MQSFCHMSFAVWATTLIGMFYPTFALSATAAAEDKAAVWLRAHRDAPQPDELAELKEVNPEAYGLVKALLTKRSLGLLDPKHPTASFAAAPPGQSESVPSGPGAFEKIAEESGETPKVAPLYPDVPAAPAHHDWLSWKPQQGALDDDAMVQNVLGAAAEVKAESQAPQQSPANTDAPIVQAVEAPIGSVAQTDAKPMASMSQENSYLKGMDFGMGAQKDGSDGARKRSRSAGSGAASKSSSSENFLASFSWGDDAPPPQATTPPPSSVTPVPPKKNALLAWLEPEVKRTAPKPPSVPVEHKSVPESEENSYLKGLDLN